MSNLLFPVEIYSIIMDMADMKSFWKQRFTNDVLSLINKEYRLVGFICEQHTDELCDCKYEDLNPCGNCYCYGYDKCLDHLYWDFISFEKIHDYSYVLNKYPSISKETFLYVYDIKLKNPYIFGQSRSNQFLIIRNNLKQQLPLKRIEYIKRTIHLWDNKFELIDECFTLGQQLIK